LTVKDAKLLRKYTISSEEVYISIAGTIGLVGTIPKKLDNANLTENAAKLIIIDKEKLNRDYLVSFLASNWGQNQIKIRTSKTSQPKLALTRIKTIKIPLPKQITQMQITMILSSIDNKIQAEENKKKALEDLFSSLLHNLMTAKIRVNDLDLEGVEI
jgi:type I restriction enzyme S subunit